MGAIHTSRNGLKFKHLGLWCFDIQQVQLIRRYTAWHGMGVGYNENEAARDPAGPCTIGDLSKRWQHLCSSAVRQECEACVEHMQISARKHHASARIVVGSGLDTCHVA